MILAAERLRPFSPAAPPAEALRGSFAVREAELAELLTQVRHAAQGAPQHLLVLGGEGMGKTTLLRRFELAVLDDEELARTWLPVRFDEILYHLGGLADLWLETLGLLTLTTGDPGPAEQARALPARYPAEALEEAARAALQEAAARREQRLLLLVDRLDLVLGRVDDDVESSRLREVLQHESWLMLVGASGRSIEATYDYEQPFYDLFHVLPLEPLSFEQAARLLRHQAGQVGAGEVAALLDEPGARPRLRLLLQLAGGSPRAVAQLFEALREVSGGELAPCLDGVLDRQAPRHRERLEQLPRQAQRVFDALARHWDPATAEEVAAALRLDRGAVSGQLHRLAGRGLVEKVDVPGRALGFQVRDRQLGLWYLSAHRVGRSRLLGLLDMAEAVLGAGEVEDDAGGAPPAAALKAVGRALEAGEATAEAAARELAALAERGDEELALQARALARHPLEQAPENPAVQLALARLEARLVRGDAALLHLREGLAGVGTATAATLSEVIGAVAAIVRAGFAGPAAEVLDERVGEPRLVPLAHAVALAGRTDAQRLRRLSPEMRAVVEQLLSRLGGTRE